MTTQSPKPFPLDGRRQLSPNEQLQRLNALSCTMNKEDRPTCSGQVYIGIFFDGTGNNLTSDYGTTEKPVPPEKRKHSNIVRLYNTYRNEPDKGYLSYYIPGVGTPFPDIDDDGEYWGPNLGSACAEKGEARIIWALTRLLNAPNRYVLGSQLISRPLDKTISNTLASVFSPGAQRRLALNTWQDKLKAALKGKKPKVEQINLSVFGFSRGAAEARVFVNWLFEVCKREEGAWTFAGIPIRVQFLGIFDTVASVGLANLDDTGVLAGHQSWADNSLEIHPAVEQCVHYVAGHEVRACFPLDSVRVKSVYPGNAVEVMYPGAHSDLGGGYAPKALGVSPAQESFMSIIPGRNMYVEAIKSGVPLLTWEHLTKQNQDDLTPSAEVIRDFNAYLHKAQVGSGPVEEMACKHMSLYFSYRFKHRAGFFQRKPYVSASPTDQGYLRQTQQCLIERLSLLARDGVAKSGKDAAMASSFDPVQEAEKYEKRLRKFGIQPLAPDRHLINVAKAIKTEAVTPEIEKFFDSYVHDSMAGFIDMGMNEYKLNGIGIAKFRTTFKGND
jgi:hypothetical protein